MHLLYRHTINNWDPSEQQLMYDKSIFKFKTYKTCQVTYTLKRACIPEKKTLGPKVVQLYGASYKP